VGLTVKHRHSLSPQSRGRRQYLARLGAAACWRYPARLSSPASSCALLFTSRCYSPIVGHPARGPWTDPRPDFFGPTRWQKYRARARPVRMSSLAWAGSSARGPALPAVIKTRLDSACGPARAQKACKRPGSSSASPPMRLFMCIYMF